MKKKIRTAVVVIIVLLLAAAGTIEYFRLKKLELPPSNAITAIPINASFILEIPRTFPLAMNLTQSNLMWQDLLGTDCFSALNRSIHLLDSLMYASPAMHNLIEDHPLFISAHAVGQDRFGYLFCLPLGGAAEETAVVPFLKSLTSPDQFSATEYEGTTIYAVKKPGWSDFYCAFGNNILICASQAALVQQSLRQLQAHLSLLDNNYFTKVLATSDRQAMANLFVNFQELSGAAAPFVSKAFRTEVASLNVFAQWMELDLSITPNEVIMNGFTDADTVTTQYLQLFAGPTPHEAGVASLLPANTALLCSFEEGSAAGFMKQYCQYLGVRRKLYKRNEWLDAVQKQYGINPEKFFYRWMGNEVALAITEPADSALQDNTYALVRARDVTEATAALDSLQAIVTGSGADKEPFHEEYMKHTLRELGIENLLPNMLGETFNRLKKSYYTAAGDYIVFANSTAALEGFINLTDGGNTLAKDPYYQAFIRDHVSGESSLFIYNNIALSPLIYRQELDKTYSQAVKEHTDIIKKFQALALQFTPMQGMFYTNAYLKRNPQYKRQPGALWQASLDTAIGAVPCWVTDFRTKNKFVLAQDVSCNLYLIGNTGKREWKRAVNGRIMGLPTDVDALRNGKNQYLFNTSQAIYLIDRNGNNVAGFPVKMPSPATAPISVFDYDGDKKYRIIVCNADKVIREYDVAGNAVKDWVKPQTGNTVKCPVVHTAIAGKDYLIVADASGTVYGYSRKGEVRLRLSHKLPPNVSRFFVTPSADLQNTFIQAADSAGTVSKLTFTDELTTTKYLAGSYRHTTFTVADLEGRGEPDLVFLTPEELYAYKSNGTQIFRYSASDTFATRLFKFVFPDGKTRLGAWSPPGNKIYLWDSRGNVCSGFPMFGSLGMTIADMNNDGQYYLVTGSPDNLIYVYSLP